MKAAESRRKKVSGASWALHGKGKQVPDSGERLAAESTLREATLSLKRGQAYRPAGTVAGNGASKVPLDLVVKLQDAGIPLTNIVSGAPLVSGPAVGLPFEQADPELIPDRNDIPCTVRVCTIRKGASVKPDWDKAAGTADEVCAQLPILLQPTAVDDTENLQWIQVVGHRRAHRVMALLQSFYRLPAKQVRQCQLKHANLDNHGWGSGNFFVLTTVMGLVCALGNNCKAPSRVTTATPSRSPRSLESRRRAKSNIDSGDDSNSHDSESVLIEEQLSIFMLTGRQVVITVHESYLLDSNWSLIRDKINDQNSRLRRSFDPSFFLYAFTDAIVDAVFPILDTFIQVLVELESVVAEGLPPADTGTLLYRMKNRVKKLRLMLWVCRELVTELVQDEYRCVTKATKDLLFSVSTHCKNNVDIVDRTLEQIGYIEEIWSDHMTQQANRTMQMLAEVAIFVQPATLWTGPWSTNWESLRVIYEHQLAYYVWWGCMILIQLLVFCIYATWGSNGTNWSSVSKSETFAERRARKKAGKDGLEPTPWFNLAFGSCVCLLYRPGAQKRFRQAQERRRLEALAKLKYKEKEKADAITFLNRPRRAESPLAPPRRAWLDVVPPLVDDAHRDVKPRFTHGTQVPVPLMALPVTVPDPQIPGSQAMFKANAAQSNVDGHAADLYNWEGGSSGQPPMPPLAPDDEEASQFQQRVLNYNQCVQDIGKFEAIEKTHLIQQENSRFQQTMIRPQINGLPVPVIMPVDGVQELQPTPRFGAHGYVAPVYAQQVIAQELALKQQRAKPVVVHVDGKEVVMPGHGWRDTISEPLQGSTSNGDSGHPNGSGLKFAQAHDQDEVFEGTDQDTDHYGPSFYGSHGQTSRSPSIPTVNGLQSIALSPRTSTQLPSHGVHVHVSPTNRTMRGTEAMTRPQTMTMVPLTSSELQSHLPWPGPTSTKDGVTVNDMIAQGIVTETELNNFSRTVNAVAVANAVHGVGLSGTSSPIVQSSPNVSVRGTHTVETGQQRHATLPVNMHAVLPVAPQVPGNWTLRSPTRVTSPEKLKPCVVDKPSRTVTQTPSPPSSGLSATGLSRRRPGRAKSPGPMMMHVPESESGRHVPAEPAKAATTPTTNAVNVSDYDWIAPLPTVLTPGAFGHGDQRVHVRGRSPVPEVSAAADSEFLDEVNTFSVFDANEPSRYTIRDDPLPLTWTQTDHARNNRGILDAMREFFLGRDDTNGAVELAAARQKVLNNATMGNDGVTYTL